MVIKVVLMVFLAAVALGAQNPALNQRVARTSPMWVKKGVVYQIWLRSFTPEGTLRAAQKRLPDVVFGERGSDVISILNFTLDGVPMIYNGQEIGDATPMDLMDRVSIPWNAAVVPTGGLLKRPFYQRLCHLKRNELALIAGGDVIWLEHDQPDAMLAFLRRMGDEEILVAINLSNRPVKAQLKLPACVAGSYTYRNLLAEVVPQHGKPHSTDWIEAGIQSVINNANDLTAKKAEVTAAENRVELDFAGFDYFVGRKMMGASKDSSN